MSRLARALILGAVMATMNLAGMTAVAQAQSGHDDAVQRFRQGERASQEQLTDDAVQVSAERKPWLQARDRADTSAEPRGQVPVPVRPVEPSGQSDWLVISLGVLAAAMALVAGLALLAARRANNRARVRQAA
jgi:hypothetical protein